MTDVPFSDKFFKADNNKNNKGRSEKEPDILSLENMADTPFNTWKIPVVYCL